MISFKSMVLTMSHSRDIRWFSLSGTIVDRNRDLIMKDNFESVKNIYINTFTLHLQLHKCYDCYFI